MQIIKNTESTIKKCKQCSIVISHKEKSSIFCSNSCSAKYNNPKRSKTIDKTCLHCLKLLSNNKKTYCDTICYNLYKKEQKFKDVINGIANAKQVKKYLIEKYGNICLNSKCCWDFSKQSINVELEHIDGNSSNNTLSNTTLLCPNCHSLTSTYKGKNKGNGRYKRRDRYKKGKSY